MRTFKVGQKVDWWMEDDNGRFIVTGTVVRITEEGKPAIVRDNNPYGPETILEQDEDWVYYKILCPDGSTVIDCDSFEIHWFESLDAAEDFALDLNEDTERIYTITDNEGLRQHRVHPVERLN